MTRNKTLLMVAVLTALGAGTALAAQSTPEAGKPTVLDRNGDGSIERSEAAAAHPWLAEHFDAFDTDHDGKLGPGEPRRKLDTDQDGRISRSEAAAQPRFAERFARMDVNQDGFFDRADRELIAQKYRDEWFAKADTDHDGKLSRSEYAAADAQRRAGFRDRMQARGPARFARLDANQDGRISRDEAKDHPRLLERFDQLDANRDGVLAQDELKRHHAR